MQKMDGMNYAPESSGVKEVVVSPGKFMFSVVGLDHGHIYAMTTGLLEAGATLLYVFDEDTEKVSKFIKKFPQAKAVNSIKEIIASSCSLVVSAIRPDKRIELGLLMMKNGKDFFVDKPGFLRMEDAERIRCVVQQTCRKYFVYFGERVHVEGAVLAQHMIDAGYLGNIVSIQILAPHRLNPANRPEWFWHSALNGGIITDIGSHQLEQLLSYAHAKNAHILSSVIANKNNAIHPDFQDFGQVSLVTDNGVAGYCRVDWFTPDGLGAWGDGRVFIVGTKGTLEIRKYIDVANSEQGDQLYFVDAEGEHHIQAYGKTGFPFFGQFILDCINRTENSMTQEHVLAAMCLAISAQETALVL